MEAPNVLTATAKMINKRADYLSHQSPYKPTLLPTVNRKLAL